MREPFQYYPMSPDEFEEFRDESSERLRQHVLDADEYYGKNMPGLEHVPWRDELAYYRQQDYPYWENMATKHSALAESTLLRYRSLTRREAREGVAA